MSNNSIKIAAALFIILAVPGAAFARGGGFAPTGHMGARAAAINAANEMHISSAAAVTTRPMRARPSATLSSLSARVRPDDSQYSRIRDTRNTS